MDIPQDCFLPGGRFTLPGAPHGPLAGLTFAAKDLFDVAGHPTGGGNPDWARQNPVPTRHAWAVQSCWMPAAPWSARPSRTRSRSASSARTRSRDAAQPGGAGPRARRLLLRLGQRRGAGAVRHGARHRHRRFRPGAGELLRPPWASGDPWPPGPDGDAAPGAPLRHGRLVRPRRRTFARVSSVLLGEAIGGAGPGEADRRGRRVRLRDPRPPRRCSRCWTG
jgi:hypothetical protein